MKPTELELSQIQLQAANLPLNVMLAQISSGIDSNPDEPILTAPQGYINEAVKQTLDNPENNVDDFLHASITKTLATNAIAKINSYLESHPAQ